MFDSLWPHGLHRPWNSPGQNTEVGSLPLLQGIFPNQGSNPGLPHCRQILYQLSYNGSPRLLEWVAYPFSSGSSRPRNQTQVSCIAGGFFTNWAIREARLFALDGAKYVGSIPLYVYLSIKNKVFFLWRRKWSQVSNSLSFFTCDATWRGEKDMMCF